jgi:hypothetical protein
MTGTAARAGLIVASGAIAIALGLAPGALSLTGAIALAVLGLGALAVIFLRSGMQKNVPQPPPGVQAEVGERPATGPTGTCSDRVMRVPRLLFYAGALLVAQSSLRTATGLTVSEIFFILSFGLTCIAVLAGRPTGVVPSALVVGVGLFAFGGLISSPNAASTARSVVEVFQGVYVMLLWAWTGATVLRTRSHILTAISLFTFSAAINGLGAIAQTAGSTALTGALQGGRATSFTTHANDLGGICAVALVPALMLATTRLPGQSAGGLLSRAARWVILGLIAAGLVLSGSVTAMVAALVVIVVWMAAPAVRAPGRVAVVTGLAFALLAVALVGGKATSPTERVTQVSSSSGTRAGSGTADVRIRTVQRALPRIEQNPVVGVGLDGAGGLVTVIDKGQETQYQVHSAPIAAWYEAGVFGVIGIFIVAYALGRTSWRSLSGGDETDLVIGLAIFASGIAFVIIALTSPFDFQQYGWFTAVLAIAWGARRKQEAKVFVTTDRAVRTAPAMVPQPLAR